MTPQQRADYSAYSQGDRSPPAKAAKAAYTREHRAVKKAAAKALNGQPVPGIKHGLAGYQDHYCRCPTCREAKRIANQRDYTSRRTRR